MNQTPYIELNRDEVALSALRLWRAAGSPPGRTAEFWMQALVELLVARSLPGTHARSATAPVVGTRGARGRF